VEEAESENLLQTTLELASKKIWQCIKPVHYSDILIKNNRDFIMVPAMSVMPWEWQ
jgi:hypothetical protein